METGRGQEIAEAHDRPPADGDRRQVLSRHETRGELVVWQECQDVVWTHGKVRYKKFASTSSLIIWRKFNKLHVIWYSFSFLASLRGHVQRVYQIAWSADSRLLCSSSADSTLKLWNAQTRKLFFDLPGHADEVRSVFLCIFTYSFHHFEIASFRFMLWIGAPTVYEWLAVVKIKSLNCKQDSSMKNITVL